MAELLEYRRQPVEDFVHDRAGRGLEFLPAACGQIEGAGLITAENARGLGSGARQVVGSTAGRLVRRLTRPGRRPRWSGPMSPRFIR